MNFILAKELSLFNNKPIKEKKITAECCIHHLWFNDSYYDQKGSLIKWNPAVKKESDRKELINAINNNVIDVIATDHAPHTIAEKNNKYLSAPSGGPLVQHALLTLLELENRNEIELKHIVKKTSHDVADCFNIEKRGYLRPGYFADIVLIKKGRSHFVDKENILYKCGWSPFEGLQYNNTIESTFVNGTRVYHNGIIIEGNKGKRLTFSG